MKALTYGSTLQFSTSVGGEIGSFNQNFKKQQTQQHFINLNPLKLKRHRTLNLVPAHVSEDSNGEWLWVIWFFQIKVFALFTA